MSNYSPEEEEEAEAEVEEVKGETLLPLRENQTRRADQARA